MIITGDNREILPTLSQESVDCVITSPPYFRLRDYDAEGQIGMETTPQEYISELCSVFHEVKRILNSAGTLWINLGDSYSKSSRSGGYDLPPKNLLMIPARVALALQADGWILRQNIIWHKPNAMPESVRDRCTRSYEHLFMFSKTSHYYYDAEAVKEPISQSTRDRNQRGFTSPRYGGKKYSQGQFDRTKSGNLYEIRDVRNMRDVWTIPTKPFYGAHFATFPPELISPCILAGCPPKGIVLDPFFGAGTTGMVASELGRDYIGIEINPDYVKIAEKRIQASKYGKTSQIPKTQAAST